MCSNVAFRKARVRSKTFVTPKIHFEFVVLRLGSINKESVHDHEDDAVLHERDNVKLDEKLTTREGPTV